MDQVVVVIMQYISFFCSQQIWLVHWVMLHTEVNEQADCKAEIIWKQNYYLVSNFCLSRRWIMGIFCQIFAFDTRRFNRRAPKLALIICREQRTFLSRFIEATTLTVNSTRSSSLYRSKNQHNKCDVQCAMFDVILFLHLLFDFVSFPFNQLSFQCFPFDGFDAFAALIHPIEMKVNDACNTSHFMLQSTRRIHIRKEGGEHIAIINEWLGNRLHITAHWAHASICFIYNFPLLLHFGSILVFF